MKKRLDILVYEKGFAESREKAKAIIMAGQVYVDNQKADKCGAAYDENVQLEVRQNRIMTLLTVVTTIFMPLTLVAGWYGMNFRYMPELEWRLGYPIVIIVSIAIVVFCLILFKKKKWL